MANNQGIITEVFPSNERGRALGISGVFAAVGTMCGPPLGGIIVSNLSWNYIFIINIPVGIISLIAGLRLLPMGQKTKSRIDITGAVLLAATVLLFFYGLLAGEKRGYTRPEILTAFALSIVTLVLFIRTEKRNPIPILDLSLFKNPIFSLSILCVLIQFVGTSGVSIVQPFFMEDVLKLSAAQTGLVMMSTPIAMGITSP
jgi:predicted MFS family arabinose efflux permease